MSRIPRFIAGAALVVACATPQENVVHVIADQAHGLKKAARVQFRGTDVGSVKQVYFTPSGVRIDLLIEREDVPIRTQDTVRIKLVGAFGQQIVDIIPGVQTAPLIPKGATMAKAKPDSAVLIPVGVWRSVVQSMGVVDTTDIDSAAKVIIEPRVQKKKP